MSHSIRATVLQTPTADRLVVLQDVTITVADDGTIQSIEDPAAGSRTSANGGGGQTPDLVLGENVVLLPGLIDTHIHAPQWPQLGTRLDLPLERWLFEYTFPLEARYEDLAFAKTVWDSMVPALLRRGTTTAVYYGSTHEPATTALAEACLGHGQRAFVGRVAMDHKEGTPEWYRDADAKTSVAASHRSIETITGLANNNGLVRPIVTPRFIPACSDAALEGLGELAASTETLVQTHCSESDWEHGYVLDRFGTTDTEALHRFGLAVDHSVLAHATHLTDEDRNLLATVGAGVSHCPLSNSYFSNAVFSARQAIDAGVRVGLGTDIAGGAEASLLAQCGHAVTASRMLEAGVDVDRSFAERGRADSRLDITAAFWMATIGGADLLGIPAGLLEPGRSFDAIAVDLNRLPAAYNITADDWESVFESLVRNAETDAIQRIWVQGRDVTPD